GENNFVAGFKFAPDGARKAEGDSGHVLAEHHFLGSAVEKIGHCGAGGGNEFVGSTTGEESAVGVRVGFEKIFLNCIHDLTRDLRAGRAIEKSGGVAVNL